MKIFNAHLASTRKNSIFYLKFAPFVFLLIQFGAINRISVTQFIHNDTYIFPLYEHF